MFKNINISKAVLLTLTSILIGMVATVIATTLKITSEHFEHICYTFYIEYQWAIFIFPVLSLMLIMQLRKYFFNHNQNRGIKEITETLKDKSSTDNRHYIVTLQNNFICSHYF